jgi:hypothetical protein
MGFDESLVKRTKMLLSSYTGTEVTTEDARQSLHNLSGFLRVLLDWHARLELARRTGSPKTGG